MDTVVIMVILGCLLILLACLYSLFPHMFKFEIRSKLQKTVNYIIEVHRRRTEARKIAFNREAEERKIKWLGSCDVLKANGFYINRPLTYRSNAPCPHTDPSEIDISLSVKESYSSEPLPYWPFYAKLTSSQRFTYLKWLSAGCNLLPPEDGYLFIYYYGLERRALVDDTDHAIIFAEVQRLREVYQECGSQRKRNSFMNYSSAFLWFLAAHRPKEIKQKDVQRLAQLTRSWNEEKLAAALAWCSASKTPLPAWLAFVVAGESPQSQRSVVTKRAGEEFRTLFEKRYKTQHNKGIKLKSSKQILRIAYNPASEVIGEKSAEVDNPISIKSQFKSLSEIWNSCITDLRKLSTTRKSQQNQEMNVQVWDALPIELKDATEHPSNDALCALVSDSVDAEGHVFIEAGQIAKTLGFEHRLRYTTKQSKSLAVSMEYIGFAIEPDARLTGKGYQAASLVVVFPQAYEGDPNYQRYGAAACMMRLGISVAEADGSVDAIELKHICNHIEEAFDLNDHERRRLEALKTLLARTGSDITGLGKRLQSVVQPLGRQSIARLLMAVAASDGIVTEDEQIALKKCFRALGLTANTLDTLLHDLSPKQHDELVTVAKNQVSAAGETIPQPLSTPLHQIDHTVRLDKEAISRIMHETREVSSILAAAMDIPSEESPLHSASVEDSVPTKSVGAVIVGSPGEITTNSPFNRTGVLVQYTAFLSELVTREQWPHNEANELARRHGHMLGGALESINQWSYEVHDDQLIYEDENGLEVQLDLLEGSD